MQDVFHAIGFGLVTASILALSTVALSLQYSVTNVPNFAHGDLMTVGAYAAYTTSLVFNNVAVEAIAALSVTAVATWSMNHFLIQPFVRAGARNTILLVVTFAVALFLQSSMQAIFGSTNVQNQLPNSAPNEVGPFLLTQLDELIIVAAIVLLATVHLVLRYTKFGKAQRAVSDNPQLARVTGIDSDRVIELTWLWAGAMTGFSGFVLAAQIGSFNPSLGFSFLLVVLAAAVVGGIGQIYGSMLGALLIGIGMEVSAVYIPGDYKTSVAFVALIVTLLVRPNGIFAVQARTLGQAR